MDKIAALEQQLVTERGRRIEQAAQLLDLQSAFALRGEDIETFRAHVRRVEGFNKILATERDEAKATLTQLQAEYHELIMAVGKKYPGETRHHTALRYIKQAEDKSELRSALELCVARLEGLKEDGITQAEQQALDVANAALAAQIEEGE